MHDDDADRTAWIGHDAIPISGVNQPAHLTDAPPIGQAKLIDALTRAAIGTGASVRILPAAGPVRDGIGALLRWSNRAS